MSTKSRPKRRIQHLQSPTSPNEIEKPAKIQATSNENTEMEYDKIVGLLESIQKQQHQFNDTLVKFNDKTDDIKNQIAESHSSLKQEMNQLVDSIKTEFKSELETINRKIDMSTKSFSKKVDEINDTVSTLDERVTHIEKDYERVVRLNELKLSGIPVTENENLLEIFTKIAEITGYDTSNTSNIPSMSRQIVKNKATNELNHSTTIILKFIAVHLKDTFYSLYLRLLPRKKLSAKDLGFTSENRIFVGENLSQHNFQIFLAANALKHDKKLSNVFTTNGIVNVRIQKAGAIHEIRHKHQLDTLLKGFVHTDTTNVDTTKDTQQHSNTSNSSNTNGTTLAPMDEH